MTESSSPPGREPTDAADPLPARRLTFTPEGGEPLSALLITPAEPWALYVYGHGAGAGMEHPFMEASAQSFARRGIATFRYNFHYMEHRLGRPDRTAVLLRTVRAAVEAARSQSPDLALIAGGKSMGGRMTSNAHAGTPLADVRGLVFVGFPLHRPKEASTERARHLDGVTLPMLFLQGTRDEMAEIELVRQVSTGLGDRATLHEVEGADHSFHVLKRSGRTNAEVLEELADTIAAWARTLV